MDKEEPKDQGRDKRQLFKVCLLLSLLFHVIIGISFYLIPPVNETIQPSQPTMIRLVDAPQKPQKKPTTTELKRNYEVDPVPSTSPPQQNVQSQRKADRDQMVPKEQAPKGEDARDETTQITLQPKPAITESSSEQSLSSQPLTAPKQQKSGKIKTIETDPRLPEPKIEVSTQTNPQPEVAEPPEINAKATPKTEPEQPQQPQLTPQQLFPDPRTLSRIAQGKIGDKNRTKQRDNVEIGDTVWLNLQNDLLVSFFRRFRDRIERVWNYPKQAAQQGLEGTLELLIIVNRKGELVDVLPTRGSGSDILDLAAIQAIYAGAPFGPLSEHYPHDQLKIRAYFSYRIGGRYIYGR